MTAKETSSIQVISRVSRLLDSIAAHDEPVSLKTLSTATGLHPSTTFRILASLIEHRFVERSESGRYQLGAKLLHLGHRVRSPRGLRRETHSTWESRMETAGSGGRESEEIVSNSHDLY